MVLYGVYGNGRPLNTYICRANDDVTVSINKIPTTADIVLFTFDLV